MTAIVVTAAFVIAAAGVRFAVVALLRRAVAWEDGCRSRWLDRRWEELEPRWSRRAPDVPNQDVPNQDVTAQDVPRPAP